MNARKILLPLALFFLLSQSFYAQTVAPDSSVTIKIRNSQRIVSGSVASENLKNQIVEKIRGALGGDVDASLLKIVPIAADFRNDWQRDFDKSLAKIKNWKTGIFVFYGNAKESGDEYPNLPEEFTNAELYIAGKKSPVKLADYSNKIVALIFIASWCGPCRTQADEFEKFYLKTASPDFEIIAVDSESAEERKEFAEFVKRRNFRFQTAWTDAKLIDAAMKISKFKGIPQTFVVRNGKLYGIFVGASHRVTAEFQKSIEDLLKDKNL